MPNVSVPSHSYFLDRGLVGRERRRASRTPDVVTGLGAGGSNGQVFLARQTTRSTPWSAAPVSGAAARSTTRRQGHRLPRLRHAVDHRCPIVDDQQLRDRVEDGRDHHGGSYKRTSLVDGDNNNTDFTISPVNEASGSGTGLGPDNCDCVATPSLKITEVYTDGGQAGSSYDHDFVELQNICGSTLVHDWPDPAVPRSR